MKWLNSLREPWGLMRWMRLGLALALMYEAYQRESWWILAFGLFLIWQAVANVGCTSCETTGSCTTKRFPEVREDDNKY